MTSLVNKTGGGVEVFGHDIDRELEVAKSCIGIVPQEINFNMFESVFTIVVNQAGFYGIDRAGSPSSARRNTSSSCSSGTGATPRRAGCRAA